MSRFQAVHAKVRDLMAQGRALDARTAIQRAIQSDGQSPELTNLMAFVLMSMGAKDPSVREQAVYYSGAAAKARPDNADFAANHAAALGLAGKRDEAVKVYERVLKSHPRHINSLLGIMKILGDAGKNAEASTHGAIACREVPRDRDAVTQTLQRMIDAGLGPQAAELSATAAAHMPEDVEITSFAAFYANYLPTPGDQDLLPIHRRAAEVMEKPLPPPHREFSNDRTTSRRLRIGIVSPDLRHAAVSFFISSLYNHRTRDDMELYSYATNPVEDAESERFKSLSDKWCHATKLHGEDLARKIREDKVDVVVDLAGLTSDHRLAELALRMAPVQATYLGYPNTTGVREVDWRIIDSITDPAGAERHCTERLWRMDPCFLCYAGLKDAPPISPLPSTTRSHVTFGSFNNLLKITDQTARLWAGALKAVPGARLAVKTLQLKDPGSREHLLTMLERAGLERSRVDIIEPRGKFTEHLAEYANIDIALDTYPYHGTTTTCEAMWMGVPAVTLEGAVHRARVGCSLNSAVGLQNFIARDEADFAAKAATISADTAALSAIRATFRDRLLKSPLGDGKAYVARFTAAMHGMWAEYCGR